MSKLATRLEKAIRARRARELAHLDELRARRVLDANRDIAAAGVAAAATMPPDAAAPTAQKGPGN